MADQTITADKLCALTGLTDRRHRQLAKSGYFPPPIRAEYKLSATLKGLFQYYRETKEMRDALREEKTRETKARANLLEIDQRKAEGELVPMVDAQELVRKLLLPARQKILSLPIEMAGRVNPGDPELARVGLQEWADETLKHCREKVAKI